MPKKLSEQEQARQAKARADALASELREQKLAEAQKISQRRVRGVLAPEMKSLREIIEAAYPDGIATYSGDNDCKCELRLTDESDTPFKIFYNPEEGFIDLTLSNKTPQEIYDMGIHLGLAAFEGRFELVGPENEADLMLLALRNIAQSSEASTEKAELLSRIKKNQVRCNGKIVGLSGDQLVLKDSVTRSIKPLRDEPT